ncbi:unnamed protein product [Adineta steineri]|uniref:Uncharacterized protein n=1 Tax=Adineta steineri TaxID=433720 RepID=A0A820PQ76_9BILA|nr:unnamed protein product [Adineta steineri]
MQSHLANRISPGDPCRVCGFEKKLYTSNK